MSKHIATTSETSFGPPVLSQWSAPRQPLHPSNIISLVMKPRFPLYASRGRITAAIVECPAVRSLQPVFVCQGCGIKAGWFQASFIWKKAPAVPELTASVDIKLNAQVSLRCPRAEISFADGSRTSLQYRFRGNLGCRGSGLVLVSVRLCWVDFQTLNERRPTNVVWPADQSTSRSPGITFRAWAFPAQVQGRDSSNRRSAERQMEACDRLSPGVISPQCATNALVHHREAFVRKRFVVHMSTPKSKPSMRPANGTSTRSLKWCVRLWRNDAVASAVLVHQTPRTGPLRLALTGATRSGSAGVGNLYAIRAWGYAAYKWSQLARN